jgi:hypothetical protein
MNKKIKLIMLVSMIFTSCGFTYDVRHEQMDKLDRQTLDLQAKYWAWRVQNRDTYNKIKREVQNSVVMPATADLILTKVRNILDSDTVRQLSSAENDKLIGSYNKVNKIIEAATMPDDAKTAAIDKIRRENASLEAMHLALNINDRLNYENLTARVQNWIMAESTKKLFLEKVGRLLAKGKEIKLSETEYKKYSKIKKKIRKILSPAKSDEKLIQQLGTDYCMELRARYWARRILEGETDILKYMQQWNLPDAIKQKFLNTIRKKVKAGKHIVPLTSDELYKSDACNEKLSKTNM